MKRKIVIEVICFFLVVLFLYAAVSKLLHYTVFAGQIGKSPLLSIHAHWIAWFLPLSELVTCVLLILPRFRMTGLYASFGMMILFSLYIIAILGFSKNLPCSCGGVLDTLDWKEHLGFNILFVFLSLGGLFLQNEEEKNNQETGQPHSNLLSRK